MSLIELINVLSGGKWFERHLNGRGAGQMAVGSLLGIIPGCFGGFAAVSLYARRLLSFGALVAAFSASCGDAAFVMLARNPRQALFVFALLLPISFLTGLLTDAIFKRNPNHKGAEKLVLHHEDTEKNGKIGKHFFKEHIWEHVIKKHAFGIFFWCFGALLALGIAEQFFDIGSILNKYPALTLLFAVLIGIIPDSGPQIAIATMFSQGLIPFSVLLANNIVQDGHTSLPLLVEEPGSFVRAKSINAIIALAIGMAWQFIF
ncbi:MAG: arsenic efflux protein [Bacteroidales bacterium]|nr:arsenic efflux protein [Bacteroidales bacterium]MCI2145659.1 arsenic efflux protein [Bacteroidales bacterium]